MTSKKEIIMVINKEFNSVYNIIRGLHKEIRNTQGDIPATIELKQLEGDDYWNLIIKAKEGEQYCDLKGNLSMILHMAVYFKKIYNWDEKEEEKKNDKRSASL